MTKTIAIIPARGNSKRLPGKNIKLLNGIPLLAHSILYAQKHNFFDAVYVSTNDQEIKQVALDYGAKGIHHPEHLSGDFEPTVSALKHVIESIENCIENVVLLQATNPLRPDNLLNETFELYLKNDSDSLFIVSRDHQKLGKIVNSTFEPYNYTIGQRSQDLEPLYFENGLLYISKAHLILKDQIISNHAFPFLVDYSFANVDIDTQEDFDYAAYLMERKY